MEIQEQKRRIKSLNTAQLGSFGEYIFCEEKSTLGASVKRINDFNADFKVNGVLVDVKTTQQHIFTDPVKLKSYKGGRVAEVSYALVEFFNNEVRVSIEGTEISTINWSRASKLWEEWEEWRGGKHEPTRSNQIKTKREKVRLLTKEITDFFLQLPIPIDTRIIYRTCQVKFDTESPDNLIPPMGKRFAGLTTFLDFKGINIARNNFRQIVCFPNYRADELPLVVNPRLHKPKVDLKRLPAQFKFKDIDDLKANHRRVL